MAEEKQPELPAPLTPPDCNLQNFKFVPLEIDRLFNSDTWGMSNDSEKVACMSLWAKSWKQLPAASLPKNEKIIAGLSGAKNWTRVREVAMRNWTLCSDGRYYHHVMAEKALEAWIEKLVSQATGGAGNAKRWGGDFDAGAMLSKLQDAIHRLRAIAPHSETLKKKAVIQAITGVLPGSGGDRGARSPPDPERASGGESPPDSGTGRNRQGQGQGSISPTSNGVGTGSPPAGGEGEAGQQVQQQQQPGTAPPAPAAPTPALAPAGPFDDAPPAALSCPHLEILALWAEVLPEMPQHDPEQWHDTRRSHLQTRWRETCVNKDWKTKDEGLLFFRRLFGYIRKSKFLMGKVEPQRGRKLFTIELEWLVRPTNWAKVIEGKYNEE